MIGRKQPAAPAPAARNNAKPRPATGTGASNDTGRVGKLRGSIRDIVAELRKVTWPTREEARNLTIVVIGISAAVGSSLALFDYILTVLYAGLKGLIGS